MKTIIIPVKFNLQSGKLLENVVSICKKEEEVNVILLEMRPLPDSYTELLTLPKIEQQQSLVDAYTKYAALLNNTYGTSIAITTDFLYGDSPAVFRNYSRFKEASLVIYAENEWLSAGKKRTNMFRMVKRCGCELMYISSESVKASEGADIYTLRRDDDNSGIPVNRNINNATPETVLHQFSTVDNLLSDLQEQYFGNKIVSKKVSNLSRYFLKEAFIRDMMEKSNCSMALIKS